MVGRKLSVVWACALLLLSACASDTVDKTATMSPQAIYAEAQDDAHNFQWDKAIVLFDKLEARAAGTPLAQQAQLDKAYAQYKSTESVQAIATLDRFMKLYPASPALDYALYLKGIINFNDDLGILSSITRQNLSERDQKAAKESFEAFKELVRRFPESRYASDAAQRMNYIVSSLAEYEVHVARYYYKRGAYLAAINRSQTALKEYRDVPALEEALFIMVKSYDALGMTQLRDDTQRVLAASYPNSDFLLKGGRPNSDPWWKIW